jgi:prolyl-tRNA synthetase
VYAEFAENYMAMPVVKGMKTKDERFPGAVDTYTIEAMMQDRKALQSGTSHFLGQNFAKASDIKFLSEAGQQEIAWTTSWGVSTRLIGGLIMTHSDDNGLICPPKIAPLHVVIMPIFRKEEEKAQVMEYCNSLQKELAAIRYDDQPLRVKVDARDIRGGDKAWQYIKQGVPVRIEVGPRDIAKGEVFVGRRDKGPKEKAGQPRAQFVSSVTQTLDEIQQTLFDRAKAFREENTKKITTLAEFEKFFTGSDETGGFAYCPWNEAAIGHELLTKLKVTPRCIPLKQEPVSGNCIFTGKPAQKWVIFAKAY